MLDIPFTPAAQRARPDATGARFVPAWLLVILEALLLTLLPRLPAGYRRLIASGNTLPPGFLAAFAPDAPTHAPCIALGLVPDWILPCFPNRGMRRTPVLHPRARRPRPARAPPAGP